MNRYRAFAQLAGSLLVIRDIFYWSFFSNLSQDHTWMKRRSFYRFRRVHKRSPDPDARLLNDYLYRLKISGELESPIRIFVTDKEYLKMFVKAVVGDEYNVPTIAILRSQDEVRTYQFPQSCVIKATHGSGQVIIRKSGEDVDREKIVEWFSLNYFSESGEINYRTLNPKVIVEPIVFGSDTLKEFKIFCFNGRPGAILVAVDRFKSLRRKLLSVDWSDPGVRLAVSDAGNHVPDKPKNLEELLALASRLSMHFNGLLRVDLYTNGDQILVSELTNCHQCANDVFASSADEIKLSRMIFEA